MAKVDKPDLNVRSFAIDSTGRKVFGEASTASDDLTVNYAAIPNGWFGAVAANGTPPQEWFEAAHFVSSQHLAYLAQRGVPEWVSTQEYYHPAVVSGDDGRLYITVADNTGNDPVTDDGTNWVIAAIRANTTNAFTRLQYFPRVVNSSGSGNIAWDWDTQQNMRINLTGNSTLQLPSNMPDGSNAECEIVQDATGGHTLSFATGYIPGTAGGNLPEIASGANEKTLLVFSSNGTEIYVGG